MRRLALALALGASLVVPAAAGAATGFTPKLLAGTWAGTWENKTFATSGPASIVATAPKNARLVFRVDLGGEVFGCEDPPSESGGITKGKGANHWNAAGFVIERKSKAFGTTKLVYVHKTRALTGSGSNPTCKPGLKWTLKGKFSGQTFTGTVSIVLPDGTKATSKLDLSLGGRAAPAGFTPSLLVGTWKGTWMNETFGSTGPAQIVAQAPGGDRLTFTVDFGGNVFGCQDPPPGSGEMTKGDGPNQWNAGGFTIKKDSVAFGTTTLVYDHKTRTLTGNGFNPTCNPGLKWSIEGSFAGDTFTGTISITLPSGMSATSKLSLTRS